jgi:hypothetical protein
MGYGGGNNLEDKTARGEFREMIACKCEFGVSIAP